VVDVNHSLAEVDVIMSIEVETLVTGGGMIVVLQKQVAGNVQNFGQLPPLSKQSPFPQPV